MSKKLIRGIGKVAGIVAGIAAIGTGIGAALGGTMVFTALGGAISASAIAAGASALALGSSLLSRPKAPATSTASADRLSVSIDPKTPRKFVLGLTAMATDIRDQEFSDNQEQLHRFIVVASHQVAEISEIWLDDKLAWSASGGIASEFLGYLGSEGYTLGSAASAKNISARMGSSRRYTGLAYLYLRFKLTGNSKKAESPFAQSVPSRVTIIGKGALTYDPRLDSTVPGGSGPMRANDQTTWAWSDSASRNPTIQTLWYLLGWRINGKLAVGKGIPPARIDLASFITAANLCDEPVALIGGGTQPRYRSDGVFSEGDATSVVLDQLKAAMNAELDDVDGKIRLTVLHNDLAVPVADFNDDDIISGHTWDQTAPLDETYNVVRGTFVDPSPTSLYQAVDYPEVRIASPDGIDRVETVDFQVVQDARQAQRLVKQRVARMLYSGRFTATFSYRAWKVQKNDVIRLTFGSLGWTNKLFRVLETSVQVDGQVPMVLQVEHPDIYLWDRDESPAIQAVEPTRYDPYLNPIYQDVVDPKYGDGTPIDSLRPAEPGATDGMNPEERAEFDQLDSDIAAGNAAIAAAEALIVVANSTIAEMQSEVSGLGDRILAAEGTVNTFSQTLGQQGATITTLQTTAQTQAGQLAQFQTDLSTANANVTLLGSAITGLDSSVASLGSTVSTQGAAITTSQQAITTLEGRTASLEISVTSGGNPNLLTNPDLGTLAGLFYAALPGTTVAVNPDDPTWGTHLFVNGLGSGVSGTAYIDLGSISVTPGLQYTGTYDVTLLGPASDRRAWNELIFVTSGGGEVPNSRVICPPVSAPSFANHAANRSALKVTGPAPTGAARAIMRSWFTGGTGPLTGAAFRRPKLEQGQVMTAWSQEATVSQTFRTLATLDTQYASLSSTVSTQGASITQQANALSTLTTDYASLSSTVSTQGVTITSQQTAIQSVQNGVTTVLGKAGVSIDVNGYVTGWELNNNGSAGDMTILTDRFRLLKPGGGARTEFSGGNWRVYDANGVLRVQLGVW